MHARCEHASSHRMACMDGGRHPRRLCKGAPRSVLDQASRVSRVQARGFWLPQPACMRFSEQPWAHAHPTAHVWPWPRMGSSRRGQGRRCRHRLAAAHTRTRAAGATHLLVTVLPSEKGVGAFTTIAKRPHRGRPAPRQAAGCWPPGPGRNRAEAGGVPAQHSHAWHVADRCTERFPR